MHGFYLMIIRILIGRENLDKPILHFLEEKHLYIIILVLGWIKWNLLKHNLI
jgi:hypothetical protein